MALLIIGLNHRTTPVELREKLYLSSQALMPVLVELKNKSTVIREDAIVSTCNRFEVYVAATDIAIAEEEVLAFLCQHYGVSCDELRPHLYVHRHKAAVKHLMRVASGLDSMILGEAQVLGQVSKALECASTVSTSGTLLHRMFEAGVHTGKRARTETGISRHTTSISHAAALLVRDKLPHDNPYIIVIGAGEMAELAVSALQDHNMHNITIINRTFDNAKALAEKFNVQAYIWSQLWEQLAKADVVIAATGAPHTILYKADMETVVRNRHQNSLIMVDVALPRDIDPEIDQLPAITVYDIDDLNQVVDENLAAREACVPAVNNIILEEQEKYWQWLSERNVVPVIRDLRREIALVVQAELQDALNKLGELDEQERGIVERMAHRIMNKVLHSPTVSLREQAANGNGEEVASMVRDLFNLPNEPIIQEEKTIRLHA